MIVDDYAAIRTHMHGQQQQPDIVKWIEGNTAYYMARTPHGVDVLSKWRSEPPGSRYPFSAPGATPEELVSNRDLRLPIIERLAKAPENC